MQKKKSPQQHRNSLTSHGSILPNVITFDIIPNVAAFSILQSSSRAGPISLKAAQDGYPDRASPLYASFSGEFNPQSYGESPLQPIDPSAPPRPMQTAPVQPEVAPYDAKALAADGIWLSIQEPTEGMGNFESPNSEVYKGLKMLPHFEKLDKLNGGGEVHTYPMPHWTTRAQLVFLTNGRPLKAKIELWLGPQRTTHRLEIDNENGAEFPVMAALKFKKANQVLKVSNNDAAEFPMLAGVFVPSKGRAKELHANTEHLFDMADDEEKKVIQGGSVYGGGGAVRYWTFGAEVESVQVVGWAKDTGKKSFRCTLEVLQGPNNPKKKYLLQ